MAMQGTIFRLFFLHSKMSQLFFGNLLFMLLGSMVPMNQCGIVQRDFIIE